MDRAGRQGGSTYVSFDGLVLPLCVSQLNAGKFCGRAREGVCAGRHFDLGFSGAICVCWREKSSRIGGEESSCFYYVARVTCLNVSRHLFYFRDGWTNRPEKGKRRPSSFSN